MIRLWPLSVLAVLATTCGSSGDSSEHTSSDAEPVVVFAAASLASAFTDVEAAFELANPSHDVQLNLAGSSALREQLLEGAPADVFASADQSNMVTVIEAGLVEAGPIDELTFARNKMAIAVARGNEAGVSSLADFAEADLLLGLCAATVPCGRFARQVLANVGVEADPDTNEADVRALLTKIEAGELDAGIVYASDATSSDVEAIAIPPADNVEVQYPVARLAASPNAAGAAAFLAFIVAPEGQAILADHGFLSP